MVGKSLRQQRALNGSGGVEVLLHAGKLEIALVVAAAFLKSDSGLKGESLDKVGLHRW